MPDLGSNHFRVLFTITTSTSNTRSYPTILRYNIKNLNWEKFKRIIKNVFLDFEYSKDFNIN
ncbi:hypothetical protein PZA11_000413 [Diplocarpon coronariae]